MTAVLHDAAVLPLRFTDDPPAMFPFLRLLGLTPVVTTEDDGFGELRAPGGGRVMVHAASSSATGAPAGETQLCLSVPVVDPVADALRAQGAEVRVWDETYGRQGVLVGPHGEAIALNEHQRDLYGYRGHSAEVVADGAARLAVTAVRASAEGPERDADRALFGRFGAAPVGEGDADYLELRLPGGGGIGLHVPMPGESAVRESAEPGFEDVALVRLGATTTEDLAALAARLDAAGHPARDVGTPGSRSVHVEDPDGLILEIHPFRTT